MELTTTSATPRPGNRVTASRAPMLRPISPATSSAVRLTRSDSPMTSIRSASKLNSNEKAVRKAWPKSCIVWLSARSHSQDARDVLSRDFVNYA